MTSLPRSSLLVPLYIYPLTADSWAPLYDAIQANPNLHFTIIINPNSGPGEGKNPIPDERYCINISRLNAYSNVTLIGYVRIDYCKRPLSTVLKEVEAYGRWASLDAQGQFGSSYVPEPVIPWQAAAGRNGKGMKSPPTPKGKSWHLKSLQVLREKSPFRRDRSKSPSPAAAATAASPLHSPDPNADAGRGREYFATVTSQGRRPLQMQGVFFDETPNLYDEKKAEFLETVTRAVKNAMGIGEGRLTIHNPGTMPNAPLVLSTHPQNTNRCTPDVVAIFENAYSEYINPCQWTMDQMAKCHIERSRKAFFVHSVPVETVVVVLAKIQASEAPV